MSESKNYIIPIKGLSQGKHLYEFSVYGDFFREFGNQYIKDASLDVQVELEKGSGWMNIHSDIEGTVTMECDRCLDDVQVPVDVQASLAVKFAKMSEHDVEDDKFIIMDPTEAELNLSQFIYDYVCINLPLQIVHEEGECNQEMLNRLSSTELKRDGDNSNNSPFGNLKNLLEKK